MSTFKKPAKKAPGKSDTAGKSDAQGQAERLSKSLSESAQQIWLAGIGAFGRAQVEGSKLFEGLVKEGLGLEQTARKLAGGQAGAVRDAVEAQVGHARERAVDSWDRIEKVVEDRVHRALVKLGVPDRNDLSELSRRVDTLTAELRKRDGGPTVKAARKPAAKTTARKSGATPKPRAM